MVSADYRLLPESSGMDMLEDIADVWKWVRNDLQAHLNSQTGSTMGIDLAKVAVLGDSSGGYCAVQSTLTQPAGSFKLKGQCRVPQNLFGMPMLPAEMIDAHMEKVEPGTIVTSVTPMERVDLAVAMMQYARYLEFLGRDERLYPVKAVSKADNMPPTFTWHGTNDSVLPMGGSIRFVEAFKQKHPNTPVRLSLHPGDHGFDGELTLESEGFKEDFKFMSDHCLG
ncbi:MAG: hypothetical protein MMC33_010056 [Icmadophila ericetorum]|nr:hypothetical protein [Icmadophila ericetorum]